MTNTGKIQAIRSVLLLNDPDKSRYIKLLENLGDLKINYGDYMITEPIDCNEELKRISGADYELCTALLTMLLREDHFSNGSFERRFAEGQVLSVLVRMKDVSGPFYRYGWRNTGEGSQAVCNEGRGWEEY